VNSCGGLATAEASVLKLVRIIQTTGKKMISATVQAARVVISLRRG
jgi:hypothetical protein